MLPSRLIGLFPVPKNMIQSVPRTGNQGPLAQRWNFIPLILRHQDQRRAVVVQLGGGDRGPVGAEGDGVEPVDEGGGGVEGHGALGGEQEGVALLGVEEPPGRGACDK